MLDWKLMDQNYYYEGTDLGCKYTKECTQFRVWAPTAETVELRLYEAGDGDCLIEQIPMMLDQKGTWVTKVEKDLDGIYYTYLIKVEGQTNETTDVYSTAVGVNGNRSMVLDFSRTNPAGWEKDKGPELKKYTDAIIYELHVRDLSMDDTSGIENKGLFKGMTETGTTSPDGLSTGLDHMKELGVTHVHLLPLHDFGSVDESRPQDNQFNWGYDPINYTALEGSYSTDPFHGEVRVKEFKGVVQKFHKEGLGVVMDVVYNHTYRTKDSVFEQTVPGYYYRMKGENFANGSGCGNETASDHKMMRKFMIDSLSFFAREYHIDGFRFDLMAIHDIDTMNEIEKELRKINPQIMLYGEGWASEAPALDSKKSALKVNAKKMPGVAMFNDNIRDTVKGHVFEQTAKGFVNGEQGLEEDVKFAIVGATEHSQAKKGKQPAWAASPQQSVNYISAHDDLTLWDKLALTSSEASEETRKAMNRLAAAIVYTSQGIPFMQAGEEMLRTKPSTEEGQRFSKDSYNLPDSVNSLKWNQKKEYKDIVEYYKGLTAFRKAHEGLRMGTTKEIEKNLRFLKAENGTVAYRIDCSSLEKDTKEICVLLNANEEESCFSIPEGEWNVFVNHEQAGVDCISTVDGGKVVLPSISACVLAR